MVYGLLAVVGAVILVPRLFGGADGQETTLFGQTSRGAEISLIVADGELRSVQTSPAAWCPVQQVWIDWPWFARDGQPRVEFAHDDSRFVVEERESVEAPPFDTFAAVMRGELGDDGSSARGTIQARAVGGPDRCEGTTRFSVRQRTP